MNESTIDKVVKALIQKQGDMSNSAFAKNLGISKVMWGYLRSGERKPGKKFLQAVMRTFPELTLEVMNYMSQKQESR